MTKQEQLLRKQKRKLEKALQHLEYSYNKILKLSCNAEQLNDEELETWESFAARFSRVSDIFLTQYLRSLIMIQDPAFTGSLRDHLNQAEKLGIINSAQNWLSIREMRNITAHDYSENDLSIFFTNMKAACPELLKIKEVIEQN